MGFDCSVIIPAFNRGHLIGKTIDSILHQTLRPREVIVVDDGSTDQTCDVVAGYGDRVTYLSSANHGPPAARNLGLAAAHTPWIALCDSDDLWCPDHLTAIAKLAELAPEVRYVFSNFTRFNEDAWAPHTMFDELPENFWPIERRELFPGGWVLDQPLYHRIIFRHQPIFPSATAFTRDHVDRVGGFDERLNRNPSEDLEFTLRSVQHAPIGVLTEPRVGIRRHDGNFSSDAPRTLLASISVLRVALDSHSIPEEWRRLLRGQIVARSAGLVDAAFGRQEFALLHSPHLQPVELSMRHRLKIAIARLPEPVARPMARLLLYLAEIARGSA